MLHHADQHSSYYRGRLLSSSGPFRLENLPVITKEEMRTHFDEIVTDPRLKLSELQRFVEDEGNLAQWYLESTRSVTRREATVPHW